MSLLTELFLYLFRFYKDFVSPRVIFKSSCVMKFLNEPRTRSFNAFKRLSFSVFAGRFVCLDLFFMARKIKIVSKNARRFHKRGGCR